MANTELDLLHLLAGYLDADQQAHALESFILNNFESIPNEYDIQRKRDHYWSIAHEVMTSLSDLITAPSLRLLAECEDRESLFWTPNWKWSDRQLTYTGPPYHRSVISLDAGLRLQHDLRLYNLAVATTSHVLWDLAQHKFPETRRSYSVEVDMEYPLRDLDGKSIVVSIDPDSDLDKDVKEAVASFIHPTLEPLLRLQLTHADLYPRRIEECDLLSTHERPLIGQYGVFAKHRIPDKTCVGIYGGVLLTNADRIMISDRRYLAKCPHPNTQNYFVNGENVMSLINTTFEYDSHGAIIGQDEQQINLRPLSVQCKTAEGNSISLIVFFADGDIEQGSELRWNYGYAREDLVDLLEYAAP